MQLEYNNDPPDDRRACSDLFVIHVEGEPQEGVVLREVFEFVSAD